MNSEPEFNDLRKLLALKRHEQPPPGYFDCFSDKVLSRIEALESGASAPWWRRLLWSFDARPALIGAYAVVLGGVLVLGLSWPNGESNNAALTLPIHAEPVLVGAPVPAPATLTMAEVVNLQPLVESPEASVSSVNPIISTEPPGGLFNVNGLLGTQPEAVSFTIGR